MILELRRFFLVLTLTIGWSMLLFPGCQEGELHREKEMVLPSSVKGREIGAGVSVPYCGTAELAARERREILLSESWRVVDLTLESCQILQKPSASNTELEAARAGLQEAINQLERLKALCLFALENPVNGEMTPGQSENEER